MTKRGWTFSLSSKVAVVCRRKAGRSPVVAIVREPVRRRYGPVWSREVDAPAVRRGGRAMPVLLEVPLEDGKGSLLVEADRASIPGELVLASPDPGAAAARATQTLAESLERLEPVLRTVKDKLAASAPEAFAVKFGVKLGGETGIILAKGTAEVNFEITMTWSRGGPRT
jgi:hypothetical protein